MNVGELALLGAIAGILFFVISGVLWISWYNEMDRYVPPEFRDGAQAAVIQFLDDPKVPQSLRDRYYWSSAFGVAAIFLAFVVSFYYQNEALTLFSGVALLAFAVGRAVRLIKTIRMPKV